MTIKIFSTPKKKKNRMQSLMKNKQDYGGIHKNMYVVLQCNTIGLLVGYFSWVMSLRPAGGFQIFMF